MRGNNNSKSNKIVDFEGLIYEFRLDLDRKLKPSIYVLIDNNGEKFKLTQSFEDADKTYEIFLKISEKNLSPMILFETKFVDRKHAKQLDKGGNPYIYHPLTIRDRFDDPYLQVVGVLHDVVEDTDTTLDDLRKLFPSRIVEAIDTITKRDNESKDEYYERIISNELAVDVKIQDLINNMDLYRLNKFETSLEDVRRVRNYSDRLEQLLQFKYGVRI